MQVGRDLREQAQADTGRVNIISYIIIIINSCIIYIHLHDIHKLYICHILINLLYVVTEVTNGALSVDSFINNVLYRSISPIFQSIAYIPQHVMFTRYVPAFFPKHFY